MFTFCKSINTEYLNQQDHLSIQTPSIDGSVTTPLSIIYSKAFNLCDMHHDIIF